MTDHIATPEQIERLMTAASKVLSLNITHPLSVAQKECEEAKTELSAALIAINEAKTKLEVRKSFDNLIDSFNEEINRWDGNFYIPAGDLRATLRDVLRHWLTKNGYEKQP